MRFFVVLVFFLSACVSQPQGLSPSKFTHNDPIPPLPQLDQSAFGEAKQPIEIKEIFALSRSQRGHFYRVINSPQFAKMSKNQKVYRYLERHLKRFNFYSDTLTARQSLDSNYGNCLSLAILTKALADLAGVRVSYELVTTTPVFQREEDIILSSQHVRTLLYEQSHSDRSGFYVWGRTGIIVDYFPSRGSRRLRSVDENEFIAMFYRNKAAEFMIKKDLANAYAYIQKAIQLVPLDPQALNILAVLHSHIGREDKAEEIYQYALQYSKETLEILSNYHAYLRRQGRDDEAKQLEPKIAKYENPNPYVWVDLGNRAYANQDYYQAIRFYRKATKMADYIHEPYLGMSRSYFQLGEYGIAKRMLKRAIERAHKQTTRSIYQQKYEMLKKYVTR
jgi:Tfp pilus assembly protein PilF